jgi:hypothetical protein
VLYAQRFHEDGVEVDLIQQGKYKHHRYCSLALTSDNFKQAAAARTHPPPTDPPPTLSTRLACSWGPFHMEP